MAESHRLLGWTSLEAAADNINAEQRNDDVLAHLGDEFLHQRAVGDIKVDASTPALQDVAKPAREEDAYPITSRMGNKCNPLRFMKFDTSRPPRSPWMYIGALLSGRGCVCWRAGGGALSGHDPQRFGVGR
jgi:hypothetical protein